MIITESRARVEEKMRGMLAEMSPHALRRALSVAEDAGRVLRVLQSFIAEIEKRANMYPHAAQPYQRP